VTEKGCLGSLFLLSFFFSRVSSSFKKMLKLGPSELIYWPPQNKNDHPKMAIWRFETAD